MNKKLFLITTASLMVVIFTSCDLLNKGEKRRNRSSDITAFSIADYVGVITGTDIVVKVPSAEDVTDLTPTITITGVSVSPASGESQNFTSPVIYTVTSENDTVKRYTVTVKLTYNLRDIGPSGGLIFYVDPDDAKLLPDGISYLEAAPSNQNAGIQWYNGNSVATGAIATAIGTGQANTNTIATIQGVGSYAARSCYDLVVGPYSDWFLPSKDELNKMYLNLKKGTDEHSVVYTPVTGFSTAFAYWSSSESTTYLAWLQGLFGGGSQQEAPKNLTYYYVRCVRAF